MALHQREDRLSSLPDDILIDILNRLPIKLSIVTGCLSLRWKGLWRNSTSIHINSCDFRSKSELELVYDVNDIATQITSPFIHSFSIRIDSRDCYTPQSDWHPSMDRWHHGICVRNIRELKVTCSVRYYSKLKFPNYIFQTQSLVSFDLELLVTLPSVGDIINLPILINLSLSHSTRHSDLLEKLIKACPSLEQLSLCDVANLKSLNCSNQNVRRLFIGSTYWGKDTEIVINAPKLKYMDVWVSKFIRIYFQEETTALREVKMVVSDRYSTRLKPRFYQTVKDMASRAFRNVTRLTLNMQMFDNINNLLTLVELCPILECLVIQKLHCFDVKEDDNLWVLPKPATALSRVLNKIELEIYWHTYLKPSKLFCEFVEYMLCNAINLEQLRFSVAGDGLGKEDVKLKRKREVELELCKLLYRCSNVSMASCENIFIGKTVKMSSKAGPKACGENGEIILLDSSRLLTLSP